MSVCLSVCLSVREHISGTAGPISTKFCVRIPCAVAQPSSGNFALRYVLPVLWMTVTTFGRNGRDAERWRLTRAATAMNGVAVPGRSLVSMNDCLIC